LKLTHEWHLISQIPLAAAVYLGALLLLKPFDNEDRRMLACLARQPAGEMI
jgi:hypothetical protein